MKRIFLLLSLSLSLSALHPRPASAIYLTGSDLSRSCMQDTQKDIYYCMGYVAGVIDYNIMMQSLGTAPTIDFCLPDNISIERATVAVLAYLKKEPQNNDFIAAPAVALALHEVYPCAPPAMKRKKRK